MMVLVEMKDTDFNAIVVAGFTVRLVSRIKPEMPSAVAVLEACCLTCGKTLDEYRKTVVLRTTDNVRIRQLFVAMGRELLNHSYPELGNVCGAVHSTLIASHQKWNRMDESHEYIPGSTKAECRAAVRFKLGISIDSPKPYIRKGNKP